MTKQINKKFLFILLIFISFILISAFIIEHKLGHQPCKLCLYERIPYFLSVLLIIKIFFIRIYERGTLLILSLVFIISSCLAFYHFGIEQGFFKESLTCAAGNLSENITKEELLEQLNQNIISCKEVSFRIFGFSLASINIFFSLILSFIFTKLFMDYGKN
jgi:disulfide bond formation protein DsbB|tara:strand:- start:280 stop:762 length:483 start_codon:yes stop_codon:yes gene_type:complete